MNALNINRWTQTLICGAVWIRIFSDGEDMEPNRWSVTIRQRIPGSRDAMVSGVEIWDGELMLSGQEDASVLRSLSELERVLSEMVIPYCDAPDITTGRPLRSEVFVRSWHEPA